MIGVRGDADLNAKVQSQDAAVVLKAVASFMAGNGYGITDFQMFLGDVNEDGYNADTSKYNVKSQDASSILKYVADFMANGSADWAKILNK